MKVRRARSFFPALALLLCCAVGLLAALAPVAVATLAGGIAVAGAAVAVTSGLVRPPLWAWLPPVSIAGVVVTALWPTAGVAIAGLVVVAALAVRAPPYAFGAALLLFGFEGTIKMRLTVEGAPSSIALGAALIDLALLVAIASLVISDRGRAARALWERSGRAERVVALSFAGWLLLAVLQIPVGGSLVDGVEGFRLAHFYVLALLAGVILAARMPADRLVLMLLVVSGAVAAYAAFRGIVGPTENEREFAEARGYHTVFGEDARNTGSFTGSFALASFLVPAGVFALATGYLSAARRPLAFSVFLLAMVGLITSYVRTGLVAVIAGTGAVAVMLVLGSRVPRTRKLQVVGIVALVLVGGYGATLVAGQVNPKAERRAESLRNPFADRSVEARLKTWSRSLDTVVDQPLGTGVGTVGRATLTDGRDTVYTDSSYLKVLQEQGVIGGLLFVIAVLGLVALCASRLVRIGPLDRPLGVAALAGFSGFLVLCAMGEYIEQPGKALSWTLLGIATWESYRR